MKQTMMKKICCSLFVLMLLGAVMLVLTHTAQNSVQTTEILPQIDQRPVYVECEEETHVFTPAGPAQMQRSARAANRTENGME